MSIGKKILVILFSSFVGIIANPEMPFASDSVVLTDLNSSKMVETVPLPKPEVVTAVAKPAKTVSTSMASAIVAQPTYVAPMNKIQIGGRTIEIINTDNTKNNSGNYVYKYGTKFLYGHNSANVFGVLYNLGAGATFSVTENGQTQNYVVRQAVIYEKVNDYTLKLNDQEIMMSVITRARYAGTNYDLSLMTCYGTMYAGGDASHRLVLFANAI